MYMSLGWGPGYHGRSGLIEVISTSSAAGGSQVALLARVCKDIGGPVCTALAEILRDEELWTPMIARLVPDTAMSTFTHGQQQFGYAGVPTYYLSGKHSNLGDGVHIALGWDATHQYRSANDGAVTLRSQCGGNWSCDHSSCVVHPSVTMSHLGADLCSDIELNRASIGYGYGTWYPGPRAFSPLVSAAYACKGDEASSERYTCQANHSGTGGRADMRRVAVQWMTDVW
jgi:hypothetical protein